ncbi:MAG: hypothetical protein ABIF08_01605 [Nanoarchaeota archaeon]
MRKIGQYEYPHFKMGTLLEAVEVLVKKFQGKVESEKNFSEELGHKSPKSGGFRLKLADLRRYGFLEKRGLIATERSRKIINFLSIDEKEKELSKAISDMPLWMALYERLKSKQPTKEEFILHLKELTDDREAILNSGDKILSLYKDAMNYYIVEEEYKSSISRRTENMNHLRGTHIADVRTGGGKPLPQPSGDKIMLVFPSGDSLSLEETSSDIDLLISKLQNMKKEIEKKKSTSGK